MSKIRLIALAVMTALLDMSVPAEVLSRKQAGPSVFLPLVSKSPPVEKCGAPPNIVYPAPNENTGSLLPKFSVASTSPSTYTEVLLSLPGQSALFTSTLFVPQLGEIVTRTEYFYANLQPNTIYEIKARSMCGFPYSQGTVGGPPQISQFRTGSSGQVPVAPALIAPASGADLPQNNVLLSWNTVSGATEYLPVVRNSQGGVFGLGTTEALTMPVPPSFLESYATSGQWTVLAINGYAVSAIPEWRSFTTFSVP
jgi:hypothetical protein